MTTFAKSEANDQQGFTDRIVDTPTTNDLLGFTQFTVPIARRVASATNENTPMTIGIYGEWGSGKTSFLKMVEKELIANKISPIWFNAWKYDQEDNLWSALIQTILDQAQVNGKWYKRAWIKINLWVRRIRIKSGTWELSKVFVSTFVRIAIFLISAGIFLGWSVQDITDFLNQFSSNIFPGNPVIIAFIIKSAAAVVGIVAAKPESLLKLFEVKLGIDYSKLSEKLSYKEHIAFLDQFNNEFQHIIDRTSGGKPLVVIIDDLDRCLPEKAVQVLEAIKLFLDVKNCVFLLAVDRDVIERAIAVKYKEFISAAQKTNGSSSSFSTFLGKNYFEKIIQLPFSLPPIARTDIENLITSLCPDDDTEQYSKTFAIGLPKNPRKIKRTLQIFLFLRDLAIDRIRSEEIRTSLLAKLVLIQNQFRPLYAEIVEMPELLNHLEVFFREGKSTNPTLQEKLEAFATDYLPLRDILLHSVDEQDSFVGVSVENYIFFVKTVTQASVTPREALSIEDENVVTRRYLRRVLESNRYFSRQGVSSETNQPLEAQVIKPRLNKYPLDSTSEIQSFELPQVFQRSTRNLILGSPGSGKTTLLRYLTTLHTRAMLNEDSEIVLQLGFKDALLPIFVPLSNFSAQISTDGRPTPATLLEFLQEYFEDWGITRDSSEFILRYLERGKCIILLDGLDEVDHKRRYLVAESLNAFVTLYPSNRYILTMRTIAYEQGVQLANFDIYHILPWDSTQVQEFVRKWYSRSPEKAEKVLAAISSRSELRDFSKNPLFLTILLPLYEDYGRLPTDQNKTIEEFIDVMLSRWDRARGVELDANYNEIELRDALTTIATQMEKNEQTRISKPEAIKLISLETNKSPNEILQMLSTIAERNGLLKEVEPDSYMFTHRLIQEFFFKLRKYEKG